MVTAQKMNYKAAKA